MRAHGDVLLVPERLSVGHTWIVLKPGAFATRPLEAQRFEEGDTKLCFCKNNKRRIIRLFRVPITNDMNK